MKTNLLMVCGLNPQVITETVYALCQQQRQPERIIVITTRPGRDACLSHLFDGGKGAWHQLLRDLEIGANSINFSPSRVHVVTNDAGITLDDIADEEANEVFLRTCLAHAWQESRQPDSRIFYSIAGGRKTMGACLAFAAQAYGRPQDRIFHVLVSPEFESSRTFFYPPAQPIDIQLKDPKGQTYTKSTRYAQVQLVTLPFFSFRELLDTQLLNTPSDPATLLCSLVREEKPQLIIDLQQGKLVWKGRECDLRPTQLALYTLLAEIKKDAECSTSQCTNCQKCWLPQHDILARQVQLSRIYKTISILPQVSEMSDSGILGLTPDNFHSYRSKLNRCIEKGFGAIDAPGLQIGKCGTRPGTSYGISLARERISILR